MFRSEAEEKEHKLMDEMQQCAQKIGKATVETRAYVRALSENKGLNLDKHIKQVEKEMTDEIKSKKGEILQFPILGILKSCKSMSTATYFQNISD